MMETAMSFPSQFQCRGNLALKKTNASSEDAPSPADSAQ
jgi:hypothetical protein